jgi:Raf kinase inhibitor-like YbhB/YbcL family protein
MRAVLPVLMLLAPTPAAAMTLESPDLKPGAPIPKAQVYPRCGGENRSPALAWSGAPPATKSFVVTMIDQSVRPALWSHWILVDLPPGVTRLPGGLTATPAGARTIAGNFGDPRYDGPCPPEGSGVHRYEVTVWAMPQARFDAQPDGDARVLQEALIKQSLAHATIAGTAGR